MRSYWLGILELDLLLRMLALGVPIIAQQLQTQLVSMRMLVRFLALLSRLRIWCCCELGVGCRRSLDPVLLWLWYRPAAVAPVRPLAWELPYAEGGLKTKKKRVLALYIFYDSLFLCFHNLSKTLSLFIFSPVSDPPARISLPVSLCIYSWLLLLLRETITP